MPETGLHDDRRYMKARVQYLVRAPAAALLVRCIPIAAELIGCGAADVAEGGHARAHMRAIWRCPLHHVIDLLVTKQPTHVQ
jgi:hypothetical protein